MESLFKKRRFVTNATDLIVTQYIFIALLGLNPWTSKQPHCILTIGYQVIGKRIKVRPTPNTNSQ
jgi:hypothetical protein